MKPLLLAHAAATAPASAAPAADPAAFVAVCTKPLTSTLRGKPMVLMRVCSFIRAVVSGCSTLYCGLWVVWDTDWVLQAAGSRQIGYSLRRVLSRRINSDSLQLLLFERRLESRGGSYCVKMLFAVILGNFAVAAQLLAADTLQHNFCKHCARPILLCSFSPGLPQDPAEPQFRLCITQGQAYSMQ